MNGAEELIAAEQKIKALGRITRWDDAALTSYRLADAAIDHFDRHWFERMRPRSCTASYAIASYRVCEAMAR